MEICPDLNSRSHTRNPENLKINLAKRLRYSSKNLPMQICSHNTNVLQCATLSMGQMQQLRDKFYSLANKLDQDSLLLKYCAIGPVQQRNTYKGKKGTNIKYFVFVHNKRVPICQKTFLSIFGITKHRISYVMQRFFYTGDVTTEHRGGDRKSNLYADHKESVHNFMQQLKSVESYYCHNTKVAKKQCLPGKLNITKLYKLYKSSEHAHPNVKQSYFRKVLNTN